MNGPQAQHLQQPQQSQSPPSQQQPQPQPATTLAFSAGMRQDAYQRTLEYVQNCQSWTENSETVTSTTHPPSNMTVSDMSTSLSSLLEENRYYNSVL